MSSNYRVPAVEKVNKILEIVAESTGQVSLTQILKSSNFNKSTVYSILHSLTDAGLLKKNDNNLFELGYRIGYLGARYLQKTNIVNEFQLLAKNLVENLSQTCQLSVLNQTNIIYLSKVEALNAYQLSTNPGSILPAHTTAMGKVLLSSLTIEELENMYEGYEFEKLTLKTVDNLKELKSQIEIAREQLYFQEIGEVNEELTCIAVPVFGHEGKMEAAISISMAITKFEIDSEKYIKGVKQLANDMSHRLGYWPKVR